MKSSFSAPGAAFWPPLALAVVETLVFWVLSARIFSLVDIAVAVE